MELLRDRAALATIATPRELTATIEIASRVISIPPQTHLLEDEFRTRWPFLRDSPALFNSLVVSKVVAELFIF